MILIFFLCLKLSMLHLCVSDLGYNCNNHPFYSNDINKPTIFIIDENVTTLTEQFNSKFMNACRRFYNIIPTSTAMNTVGLQWSMLMHYNYVERAFRTAANVIHFAVPEGTPLNDLLYAGTINKINDVVCHKTNKMESEFECNNEIVHLVSKSVIELNDGHIYSIVQKMDEREEIKSCKPFIHNTTDLKTVLLCRAENKYVDIQFTQPIQLEKVSEHLCLESYTNASGYLLAVLAPRPFDLSSEYSIPTIFYETPYMYSKYKAAFPNSMNVVPWRLLKYGFLKFIQRVGWQRVVIVTDDSEYSIDFEGELTALFNKEGIIYTAIRCEDAYCDMNKIKDELHKVKARIVIANVEEDNARYLFKNVRLQEKITWIVRDMAEKTQSEDLDVFSISLHAVNKDKGCGVDSNILTGVSSIAQVYKNIPKEDYKVKKREFYRRFADAAKNICSTVTEAVVIVERLHNDDPEVISQMDVNAAGAKMVTFINPFKSGTPFDGTGYCLAKSYDYFKPCADNLMLLLMCVILLFVTTILVITFFFDKSAPVNDIRYQIFN